MGPAPTPAEDAAPKVFQTNREDARDATLKKLLASPASESARTSALVTNLSDLELAAALKSTNTTLKIAAALESARRATPALVSELMHGTSASWDGKTRTAMLAAIASIKADDCAKELVSPLGLKKDEDIQEAVKTSLLRSGSPVVVDALIAHAATDATNEYLCRDVGRTLASIRNEASITNLLTGIGSPSPSVAAGCVMALAAIGEPQTVEALFAQLGSPQGPQESLLIDAIAHVRAPAALPTLSSQLLSSGSNLNVAAKRAVLTALGNFSLEQRTPILNQYLALESDSQLRAEAARLLGR